MVYIVNGQLGRISSHPDRDQAKAVGLPLYSPYQSDTCPDHPSSPHFTSTAQCQACWLAERGR